MSRRWYPQELHIDGLRFRIVPGEKVTKFGERDKDLRLDVWTGAEWRTVHMRLGGFLADFFCENEEVLYPTKSPDGFRTPWKGGQKYLDYLRNASRYGWDKAENELRLERHQKTLFDQQEAIW